MEGVWELDIGSNRNKEVVRIEGMFALGWEELPQLFTSQVLERLGPLQHHSIYRVLYAHTPMMHYPSCQL